MDIELTALTLEIALGELAAGAIEVGGNNRGPWVRRYMGVERQPWCVGFATWCYRQACKQHRIAPVIKERWSSSRLVREAEGLCLLRDPAADSMRCARDLRPGHFFVVRGGPTGFRHTGIVRSIDLVEAGNEEGGQRAIRRIRTVEGNTHLPGQSGPDKVLSRYRSAGGLVFVVW